MSTSHIYTIALYKKRVNADADAQPIRVTSAWNLTNLSFWERSAAKQMMTFGCRTVVARTDVGVRQSVTMEQHMCHVFVRGDGMACVMLTNKDYNARVAFSFMTKVLRDHAQQHAQQHGEVDCDTQNVALESELARYQDPREADALSRINATLDDTKQIMHRNISQLMQRGETIDSLLARSADLNAASFLFYKEAKKTNQCCKAY